MPIQDFENELRNLDARHYAERLEFMSEQVARAHRTSHRMEKRGFDFSELLSEAAKAQAGKAIIPPGFDTPTAYITKPAAIAGTLGLDAELSSDVIAHLEASAGYSPFAAPGAKSFVLSAAIANLSRVAQAGVHLLTKPVETEALATGTEGAVVMHNRPVSFATIEPVTFASMLDDAAGGLGNGLDGGTDQELIPGSLPLSIAEYKFDTASDAPSMGVQVLIPRSLQSSYGRERVAGAALASIVLGLTRAVDKVFLSALASASPALANFSLANAAAQGLRFDELRGLIGTTGTGATIDAMGKLRADGILAELTGDAAASYIGSFARAAIAIDGDIPLYVERRDAAGDLLVTCYCTLQALIPDFTKFWVAA